MKNYEPESHDSDFRLVLLYGIQFLNLFLPVLYQWFWRKYLHILSEGEEPAPEGWTFLNIDCGDAGVFILSDHLSIFAKFIKNHSDECI